MTATDTAKDIRSDLTAWIRRWHAEFVDDGAIDQCLQRVAEQHGPQVVATAYYDVVRLLWLDIGQGKRVRYGEATLGDLQRNDALHDRGEELDGAEYISDAQAQRFWRLFEAAKAARN